MLLCTYIFVCIAQTAFQPFRTASCTTTRTTLLLACFYTSALRWERLSQTAAAATLCALSGLTFSRVLVRWVAVMVVVEAERERRICLKPTDPPWLVWGVCMYKYRVRELVRSFFDECVPTLESLFFFLYWLCAMCVKMYIIFRGFLYAKLCAFAHIWKCMRSCVCVCVCFCKFSTNRVYVHICRHYRDAFNYDSTNK